MIPVNEENFCKGSVVAEQLKKGSNPEQIKVDKKKLIEPCLLRFCSDCLEKHYRESWALKKKSKT